MTKYEDFDKLNESKISEIINKTTDKVLKKVSKEKIKNSLLELGRKLKEEGDDYKEVRDIIKNYIKTGEKLSTEEIKIIKTQVLDTFRMGFLVGLFSLPFGSFIIPVLLTLAKRLDINLLPSAWNKKPIINETYKNIRKP